MEAIVDCLDIGMQGRNNKTDFPLLELDWCGEFDVVTVNVRSDGCSWEAKFKIPSVQTSRVQRINADFEDGQFGFKLICSAAYLHSALADFVKLGTGVLIEVDGGGLHLSFTVKHDFGSFQVYM